MHGVVTQEVWQSSTREQCDFSSVTMICDLSGVASRDPSACKQTCSCSCCPSPPPLVCVVDHKPTTHISSPSPTYCPPTDFGFRIFNVMMLPIPLKATNLWITTNNYRCHNVHLFNLFYILFYLFYFFEKHHAPFSANFNTFFHLRLTCFHHFPCCCSIKTTYREQKPTSCTTGVEHRVNTVIDDRQLTIDR